MALVRVMDVACWEVIRHHNIHPHNFSLLAEAWFYAHPVLNAPEQSYNVIHLHIHGDRGGH